MQTDLTQGSVTKSMLLFSIPMILGNLLQQLYNIVDTLIVGRFLGPQALAAVGSSFTLMVFLTSIILGLCMGSGVVFSMLFGSGKTDDLQSSLFISFLFIGGLSLLISILAFFFLDPLLSALQIPKEVLADTRSYLSVILVGIIFTFLYNFFASLLRSMGNSITPLIFLAIASVLNIFLDLLFILSFHMGVAGAALATVISQGVSAVCLILYCFNRIPEVRLKKQHLHIKKHIFRSIIQYSCLTSIQQSIMNFGILLIQGLINSFGVSVMAAFAAGVKIDSFAYMPAQDFGNAFSIFIAQNYGAEKTERIHKGTRSAAKISICFCIATSILVFAFAKYLMLIFVDPAETEVIAIGVQYLQIEGAFYWGIGGLFLLYGLYRGLGRSGMSVILTILSLGTRVLLAYVLAPIPAIGLLGIWWAIPIGWILADIVGIFYYKAWVQKKLVDTLGS